MYSVCIITTESDDRDDEGNQIKQTDRPSSGKRGKEFLKKVQLSVKSTFCDVPCQNEIFVAFSFTVLLR